MGFQHHLGPWVPMLGGIGWIVASDNAGYLLRHRYGARMTSLLDRRRARTSLHRRLMTSLRALMHDPRAGSTISYPRFTLVNGAHAVLWGALFVQSGYLLARYWHGTQSNWTVRVVVVIAGIVALCTAWSARRRRQRRRADQSRLRVR